MKNDKSYINELVRIISGALQLDINKVRNYTAFLADKFEAAEDLTTATRLRKLLDESDVQLKPTSSRNVPTIPVDEDSRFPLIDLINVQKLQEPSLILPEEHWSLVNEFTSVAKSYAFFEDTAFTGALSLLMYGAPGTGKSRLARYIARELALPLYVARLDGLISSFLGNTSKNIRALFEFASRTPCILFLDEFDAIAKLRTDNHELGELKRVVNSFVQNLDTFGHQSIVLAATNHESLLDAAVWRRFSYRISLPLPNHELRREMWELFFAPIEFQTREIRAISDLSEGYSGSDIHEACVRLKRRHHATKEPLLLSHVFSILINLATSSADNIQFLTGLKDTERAYRTHMLRQRDQHLYSHALLASLFGVSKATIQRVLTQECEPVG